jgi:tetratricopeptide (TPR) repeat protein
VAAGRLPVETYRSFCLIREKVRQEPQEVLDGAMQMVTRHPEFAPAYLLSAEALLALGNAEAARDAARDTLTHDPDPDTASAALFFDWNLSRQLGDPEGAEEAAERLQTAYRDHAPAVLISKLKGNLKPQRGLRWTFALDGTLHFEELPPGSGPPPGPTPPPDQTPPSPGSGA